MSQWLSKINLKKQKVNINRSIFFSFSSDLKYSFVIENLPFISNNSFLG